MIIVLGTINKLSVFPKMLKREVALTKEKMNQNSESGFRNSHKVIVSRNSHLRKI